MESEMDQSGVKYDFRSKFKQRGVFEVPSEIL